MNMSPGPEWRVPGSCSLTSVLPHNDNGSLRAFLAEGASVLSCRGFHWLCRGAQNQQSFPGRNPKTALWRGRNNSAGCFLTRTQAPTRWAGHARPLRMHCSTPRLPENKLPNNNQRSDLRRSKRAQLRQLLRRAPAAHCSLRLRSPQTQRKLATWSYASSFTAGERDKINSNAKMPAIPSLKHGTRGGRTRSFLLSQLQSQHSPSDNYTAFNGLWAWNLRRSSELWPCTCLGSTRSLFVKLHICIPFVQIHRFNFHPYLVPSFAMSSTKGWSIWGTNGSCKARTCSLGDSHLLSKTTVPIIDWNLFGANPSMMNGIAEPY